jgi:hypothetical protein
MGPLCVQRRFLSGGCLLSLLWPGTQRFRLNICQGGEGFFLAAIALPIGIFSCLGLLAIEYGSVVRRNDIVHVGHTAVAYLKVVPIE